MTGFVSSDLIYMWVGGLRVVYGKVDFIYYGEVCTKGVWGVFRLWDYFVGNRGDFGGLYINVIFIF